MNVIWRWTNLADMEKLTLTNKKEWTMSHPLNLIVEEELWSKITDSNKRVWTRTAIQKYNG